jgi:hypothetical protein
MKKIGLLCLALVLALGTLGIGYATWSENVTVEQTVKTGTFMVGIADMGTNDSGVSQWDPGYDKHVARTTSTNESAHFVKDSVQYYHKVVETITNAYPSYSVNITYEFANGGTIPAKLKEWTTTITEGDPLLANCIELAWWQITKPDDSTVSGSGQTDLETELKKLQIHGCETFQLVITKHFLQDCPDPQNGTYEMPQGANVTMVHQAKWVQWNKIDE